MSSPSAPSTDVDEALATAWAKVEAEWSDDAAHDKLVALCASLGRLDFAGKRYRAIRESEPDKAARADQSIDRIVALAMQTLVDHREEPPPSPKRVLLPVAILFTALMAGTALWVWLDAAR